MPEPADTWLPTRRTLLSRLRDQRFHQGAHHQSQEVEPGGPGDEPIDPSSFELEARWQEEWQQNLMEVAIERVKRQVEPKEWQVFDFCTTKQWAARKVAQHLNLFRPQVYYLNKKITRLIRNEVEKLRLEIGERVVRSDE